MASSKIGVWLIGAFGSIATTVMMGALALKKGLIDDTGMITAQEPFDSLNFIPCASMVFGGCDIRSGSLHDHVLSNSKQGYPIDRDLLTNLEPDFKRINSDIVPGTARNCGTVIEALRTESSSSITLRSEIDHIKQILHKFKTDNALDNVVVVNLASTEPIFAADTVPENLAAFELFIDAPGSELPASSIYAYAAISSGFPYINFTPSQSATLPALIALAELKRVPLMGNDGKTGETLVKSVLAPMFSHRNLEILSWEGFNILGNMDGQVLDHCENRQSKICTKDAVLSKILGYSPHSGVHIHYVPSLADQKTAWDFVHFKGFLGAKMSLQFTWQGFDSILAAPLVLDLVRWAEYAHRKNEAGLMPHLASYFKDPLGVSVHSFHEQFQLLINYTDQRITRN